MNLKIFCFSVLILLVPVLVRASSSPFPGSVRFCFVILDSGGKIFDSGSGFGASGSKIPAGNFSETLEYRALAWSAPVVVGKVDFDSDSFSTNSKLFGSVSDNAECFSFQNLPAGFYYYSKEASAGSLWLETKYNDQHSVVAQSFADFFSFDSSGNVNADGVIVLGESRPDRTVIFLNRFLESPTTLPSQFVAGKSVEPVVVKSTQVVPVPSQAVQISAKEADFPAQNIANFSDSQKTKAVLPEASLAQAKISESKIIAVKTEIDEAKNSSLTSGYIQNLANVFSSGKAVYYFFPILALAALASVLLRSSES